MGVWRIMPTCLRWPVLTGRCMPLACCSVTLPAVALGQPGLLWLHIMAPIKAAQPAVAGSRHHHHASSSSATGEAVGALGLPPEGLLLASLPLLALPQACCTELQQLLADMVAEEEAARALPGELAPRGAAGGSLPSSAPQQHLQGVHQQQAAAAAAAAAARASAASLPSSCGLHLHRTWGCCWSWLLQALPMLQPQRLAQQRPMLRSIYAVVLEARGRSPLTAPRRCCLPAAGAAVTPAAAASTPAAAPWPGTSSSWRRGWRSCWWPAACGPAAGCWTPPSRSLPVAFSAAARQPPAAAAVPQRRASSSPAQTALAAAAARGAGGGRKMCLPSASSSSGIQPAAPLPCRSLTACPQLVPA
jgi:hypothetical protein